MKPNEHSTKVPTSYTNFSDKVPISESYYKNVTLSERLKLPVSIDHKMAAFSILNRIDQKSFLLADIF